LTFFGWSDQHVQTDGDARHLVPAIDAMNALPGTDYRHQHPAVRASSPSYESPPIASLRSLTITSRRSGWTIRGKCLMLPFAVHAE
jgi:hypothetical protein